MKTIEGFKLRKLGNEYILIGESMALINFNNDVNSLCKALCAEYDVAPEQAMTDIQNTVDSWLKEGVITD